MNIRELESNDYYKKYLELLSQLTIVTYLEFEDFEEQLLKINKNPFHKIFVIEDKEQIIGSITVLIELKFIRNLGNVCHIEDVVVRNDYRGKGIARKLIEYVKNYSKNEGCYKILLNCKENLIDFYSKFGFENKNLEMSLYLV